MKLKDLAFCIGGLSDHSHGRGVFLLGWAQSSTTGGLTGAVSDSTGAAVPGATVTLVNHATNQTQTTTTDANGGYGLSLLPTGNLWSEFFCARFKTSQLASVAVNVSEVPVLDAQFGGRRIDTADSLPVPRQFRRRPPRPAPWLTIRQSPRFRDHPQLNASAIHVFRLRSQCKRCRLLGAGSQNVNVNATPPRAHSR